MPGITNTYNGDGFYLLILNILSLRAILFIITKLWKKVQYKWLVVAKNNFMYTNNIHENWNILYSSNYVNFRF